MNNYTVTKREVTILKGIGKILKTFSNNRPLMKELVHLLPNLEVAIEKDNLSYNKLLKKEVKEALLKCLEFFVKSEMGDIDALDSEENVVILKGKISSEPYYKEYPTGARRLLLTIDTTIEVKNSLFGNTKERKDSNQVVAWGDLALNNSVNLKKHEVVYLRGYLPGNSNDPAHKKRVVLTEIRKLPPRELKTGYRTSLKSLVPTPQLLLEVGQ